MQQFIEDFTSQLREAAIYLDNFDLYQLPKKKFNNVLICGLGGSGIGGKIAKDIFNSTLNIPIEVNSKYTIPAWVNEHTLVIASSYSGNTEETVDCINLARDKNASIVCITSGGKIQEICESNNYPLLSLPTGYPPRAAFGFSLACQLAIFNEIFELNIPLTSKLNHIAKQLDDDKGSILELAGEIADTLHGHFPMIYSDNKYEGVAIRFRQQINENAKMLCSHHVYPEMNHNELVGWAGGNENFAVITLMNNDDHPRNQRRMDICKKIITEKTQNFTEVESKGEDQIERTFYLVHLLDWVSELLAQRKNVDSIEVKVIDYLKNELTQ
jgi:glucose/mannose-6-phosphate isomerase